LELSATTNRKSGFLLKVANYSLPTTYKFTRNEGSIPFTRSNKYGLFLTFAGFCISFASARSFPPPEMVQASWLFPALPFLSRTRGLEQFFHGKIDCVGCNDTQSL